MKTNEQLLEVQNLGKKFKKEVVFEQLSFQLYKGDWLGVIGKNGSGKSTLAAALVGVDQRYTGDIFFQSKNQRQQPLSTWVQDVQLISQYTRNALDPTKSIQTLLKEPLQRFQIGETATWERQIVRVLAECNLDESLLTKKPRQLSGGQYQRVCIAQALLVQPKILICDEMTANLDKINELRIMKLLKQKEELTVIFISHDRQLVENSCNRYLFMEEYQRKKISS